MESKEQKVKRCAANCSKCMYKERNIGYCWYTMTTNKQNNMKDGLCEHFVDREEILEDLKVIVHGQSKRN